MKMAQVDRFLLPAGEPGIASFLFERLLAPHNLRERLRRSALRSVPALAPRLLKPSPSAKPALEMVETALRELDLPGGRPTRWLLVEDYSGNGRERLVLFLFEAGEAPPGHKCPGYAKQPGEPDCFESPSGGSFRLARAFMPGRGRGRSASPTAVLKLRRTGAAGSSLRREEEALRFLAERLPADLRPTVPRPLAWRELPGLEALAMSPLPGVSAYVEMQGLLHPGRAVGRHFEAAAAWLARFHKATGAGHGDFWARNLLVSLDGQPAVVDWEHFTEAAPFTEDLFHFPLTYGLNYPWARWRRLPPNEAFRRTFLEDNRVSRAVAFYLSRYAAEAGVDPASLRRLFGAYLETRPGDGLPWREFQSLLGRAPASVFSG